MKFKTNAGCDRCKTKILEKMNSTFPDAQWNLDLENADKILEVHGMPENAEKAAQVVKALEETGFKGSWIEQ
jgi:hypothetical protein